PARSHLRGTFKVESGQSPVRLVWASPAITRHSRPSSTSLQRSHFDTVVSGVIEGRGTWHLLILPRKRERTARELWCLIPTAMQKAVRAERRSPATLPSHGALQLPRGGAP